MRDRSPQELNFEETVLDEWARDFDVLELPLSGVVFRLAGLALVLLSVITLGRLTVLGVMNGEFYAERASANANKVIMKPAPRGIIFDRNNEPLVENVPTFRVALKGSKFFTRP
ncbi:MAG: hypothetical protein Q8Q41_03270, partial [bacterium]|nr:hypothetical protein [bacterium]